MEQENKRKCEKAITSQLANIAHDLRSPLNIILGFSEVLAASNDPAERAEYNTIIQETGSRMNEMIDKIINAHRHIDGDIKLNISEFSLETMMKSMAQAYAVKYRSKGLSLTYKPKGEPIPIISDENKVKEILDNFFSNALKYTDEGGVTFCYDTFDTGVRIHLIDTGKGISEEDCPKIFDRFEMLDASKKGSGLGLNIAREMAQALGGDIGVSSKLGKGSDFWLEIPYRVMENN